VAYASLLRKARQHSHQHITQVLETLFFDPVATPPALLAQHDTEVGLDDHAVPYWQQARVNARLLGTGLVSTQALPTAAA
jgi:hypothetical protein